MKNQHPAIRTLNYIKPYWYLIFISSVCGVIKLCVPMALPQVIRYFTDTVLSPSSSLTVNEQLSEIYKWLFILCCMYTFIAIPATYFREVCSLIVSNRVMLKMRIELYAHIQKMSACFFGKNKSGALVSRISSDVQCVHSFVWTVVTNVWIDGVLIIILVILMLCVSIPLTLISVITLPLSAVFTQKIRVGIRKNSKKEQNELANLSAFAAERFGGFATIRLFNSSLEESTKFNAIADNYYRFRTKTNMLFALGTAIINSFADIIMAVVLCLGASFIAKDSMTIGDLIVFNSYLCSLTVPLKRFAELSVAYSQSIAGIERVYEILDTPVDIAEKENAVEVDENSPIDIAFENVCFKYDKNSDTDTLSHISLSIKDGERIALVGSSGCGKTTLVSLLARFYDPDKGRVIVSGRDIKDYKLNSLYKQMGMVFQNTILFSDTIEENIRYGNPNASEDEIIQSAISANALEFIKNTPNGFKTVLGERGIGLSGGQKQRIAIARVFLKNPRILILDEATSALDSESEELVQEALDNLMKGRTSIVIAHRLSTIINADKIIVMDKGKIIEVGKHTELLAKNGRYKELYNKQFKHLLNNNQRK